MQLSKTGFHKVVMVMGALSLGWGLITWTSRPIVAQAITQSESRGFWTWVQEFVNKLWNLTHLSPATRLHYAQKIKGAKTSEKAKEILDEAVEEDAALAHQSSQTTTQSAAQVSVRPGTLAFTQQATAAGEKAIVPSFSFSAATVSSTASRNLAVSPSTLATTQLSLTNHLGTGEPWRVSAKLDAFTTPTHQFSGAVLHLRPAAVKKTVQPITAPETTLVAGQAAQTILSAPAQAGMGVSVTDYRDTTLDLPPVRYAGFYTAQLTYTLTIGPQS